MAEYSPTLLGFSSVPNQLQTLRFGSIGDGISRVVNLLDANRVVELTSTDVLGMCVPRVSIEASMRPPGYRIDAAREATIRELSGLFFNTFSAGWMSYAALRLIGSRLNWYNPHGIPARAWITTESLEGFGKLYESILKDEAIKTPAQAREKFIRTLLASMASSDRNTHFISMLTAAEGLDSRQSRFGFLKTAFAENPGYLKPLGHVLDQSPQNLVQYTPDLMPGNHGKLSAPILEKLYRYFLPATEDSALGTHLFDQKAAERTQAFLLEDPQILKYISTKQLHALQQLPLTERYDALLDLLPKDAHHLAERAFKQTRMQLSLSDLRAAEAELLRMMDRIAFSGDLTTNVQLLDENLQPLLRNRNGKPILMKQTRKTLLREMKHFLEQYIDRANYEARHTGDQWKLKVAETLYGKQDQPARHFFGRWLPKADDGLIPATFKGKWVYTAIPVIATVIAAISMAFYNNWLTQKRHGGLVISPIDGSSNGVIVPRDKLTGKNQKGDTDPKPNTSPQVPPQTPNLPGPPAVNPQTITMSRTPFMPSPASPFSTFHQPATSPPRLAYPVSPTQPVGGWLV